MKQIKRWFIAISVILALSVVSNASIADVVIIGNSNIGVDMLSNEQVKGLYLGKTTSVSNITIKLADCEAAQEEFLNKFVGQSASTAYKKIWMKKVFAEGAVPPTSLKTAEEVVKYVSITKDAIGYVPSGTQLPSTVKTLNK